MKARKELGDEAQKRSLRGSVHSGAARTWGNLGKVGGRWREERQQTVDTVDRFNMVEKIWEMQSICVLQTRASLTVL